MSKTERNGLVLMTLPVVLSLFFTLHLLVVEADFHACFENLFSGRPYRGIGEMSVIELAYTAGEQFSLSALVSAVLGLLPMSVFLIAWVFSRSRSGMFWPISGLAVLIAIVAWTLTYNVTDFHDCDRKGLSLGLLILPILSTGFSAIAAIILAVLRPWILVFIYKE